jgi:hypothetical protein
MMRSVILQQYLVKIRTNWNLARTAGDTTAKSDSSPAKVHVTALQLNSFAETRAGSIKKQNQGAKGARADHRVQVSLGDSGCYQ